MCSPEGKVKETTMSLVGSMFSAETNTTDPALIFNLAAHSKPITSIAFDPNKDTSLATAGKDKSLMLWKLDSLTNVRCYNYRRHEDIVTDIAYLHNGKLIASCSADKTVRLWAVDLHGSTSHFKPHTAAINSVAFSQSGKILTGSSDKCSKEYDLGTQRFIRSYVGHNHWVLCSRYGLDPNIIASCSDDKTVRIWDPRVQDNVHVFNTARSSGCKLAFNPSSTNPIVAVAMRSGSVRVYDLRVTRLLQHYLLHAPNRSNCTEPNMNHPPTDGASCNAIAWHPSGAYLLTGGADNRMQIVDTVEGRPVYTLDCCGVGAGEGVVRTVAFNADGEWFAAGGNEYVKIWKTNFISRPVLSASSLIED